jgi:hypothetical protein
VKIAGYPHTVYISPKDSHFADVNLLGSPFLSLRNIALAYNGNKRALDVMFGWGKQWECRSKL